MALIGYARVSTEDKNQRLDSQLKQLKELGCERIFQEQQTGTWDERPEWKACVAFLRPGDVLVATELNRLSRNTRMLLELVEYLEKQGVGLKLLNGFVIDTTTAVGKLMFTLLAALAEFERNNLVERTRAGLAAARARGRNGGRPHKLLTAKKSMLVDQFATGKHTVEQLAHAFDISPTSVRRFVREAKIAGTYPKPVVENIIQPSLAQIMQAG